MSAEILRRAAALMRERAEAATEGPWRVNFIPESAVPSQHIVDRWYVMGCFDGNPRNPTGPAAMSEYEPDVEHIASWHPAVALAVADLLDVWADNDLLGSPFTLPEEIACITDIASAYLGALTLPPIGRWSDRRVARAFDEAGVQYGPRIVYGPTCPIAADESVTRVLGWADPFASTRREIAALEEIA